MMVVLWAEETGIYSWPRFCTVNCLPTASNYKLSHLKSGLAPNPDLRGGKRECYHSATMAPPPPILNLKGFSPQLSEFLNLKKTFWSPYSPNINGVFTTFE